MNVVWHQGAVTAAGVVESLQGRDPSWHPKTAGTLLNRLVHKRALGFRKEGRGYVYFPLVAQAACVGAESDSFLKRLFGGSFKPLLVHMVEHKKLSSGEIKELRAILDVNETRKRE